MLWRYRLCTDWAHQQSAFILDKYKLNLFMEHVTRLGSAEVYKIDRTTAAMVPIAILPREQSSLDEISLLGSRATDSGITRVPTSPYMRLTASRALRAMHWANSASLHPDP